LNPATFKTGRDWVAELRVRQQIAHDLAHTAQVGMRRCLDQHLRWLGVVGDLAGTGLGKATAFCIGEGCRVQLSPAIVDELRDARKAIRRYGTAAQWKWAEFVNYEVQIPDGYSTRKMTFKVTPEDRAACDALVKNVGVTLETAAKIGIVTVLSEVPEIPEAERTVFMAERWRWRRYLNRWAKELAEAVDGKARKSGG
jgi:hypothetical protein